MTHECVDCEEILPAERFAMVKRTGRDPERNRRCRSCQWKKRKRWQTKNNPRYEFLRHARNRYGLEADEIDAMVKTSEGLCEVCSTPFRNIKSEPHIDHCHKTGKVRGLLCTRCNLIAGTLEKETRRVRLALAYLKERR